MGKSLAEVHALERARWDARVPEAFDPSCHRAVPGRRSLPPRLLAAASDFLGELRGQRVVELGCGLGDLSLELARAGARVTAIDLSPRSIDYLRRRAASADVADAIETHVAAAERLPLFDESFDLALGHGVLHCIRPELGAPELHRVLRPGGRALFSEPLREGDSSPVLRELERFAAGFSHSEVRHTALPAQRSPEGSGAGWQWLQTTCLELLPVLRRDQAHALLLLTR